LCGAALLVLGMLAHPAFVSFVSPNPYDLVEGIGILLAKGTGFRLKKPF
jgi:hypothetical protein